MRQDELVTNTNYRFRLSNRHLTKTIVVLATFQKANATEKSFLETSNVVIVNYNFLDPNYRINKDMELSQTRTLIQSVSTPPSSQDYRIYLQVIVNICLSQASCQLLTIRIGMSVLVIRKDDPSISIFMTKAIWTRMERFSEKTEGNQPFFHQIMGKKD